MYCGSLENCQDIFVKIEIKINILETKTLCLNTKTASLLELYWHQKSQQPQATSSQRTQFQYFSVGLSA